MIEPTLIILLSFAPHFHIHSWKMPPLNIPNAFIGDGRAEVSLYPEEYYDMETPEKVQKPYVKKLGFNLFGNKRNDTVLFPGDYLYRDYGLVTNKERRKGIKNGERKKQLKQEPFRRFDIASTDSADEDDESDDDDDTTKSTSTVITTPTRTEVRFKPRPSATATTYVSASRTVAEYIWDAWPFITMARRPTVAASRSTKTLSSYFPTAYSMLKKTMPWRQIEWSRGPTGPDDIYYNFYNDYYVSNQAGRLNTYRGTPPKCHADSFKLDGQAVNLPVREELYDEAFLDYLKNRVQSYSTWSAYVKANPCFTRLAKFFGTTKILALFAARPLAQSDKNAIELYRKDYVVVTERMPTTSTLRMRGFFTKGLLRKTFTMEPNFLTKAEIDTIDEEELISRLRDYDERRKTSVVPTRTRSSVDWRKEYMGSIRTRMFSLRAKQSNIVTPAIWTSPEEPELPDWLRLGLESEDKLKKRDFDVAKVPSTNVTIACYTCWPKEGREIPKMDCASIFKYGGDRKRKHLAICTREPVVHVLGPSGGPSYPFGGRQKHYTRTERRNDNRHRYGCYHRFLDVPSTYDERSCRKWPPEGDHLYNSQYRHYALKRFMRLEKVLRYTKDGCVSSPLASLTPFGRGVSLWVRYHVCVCSTHYCNAGQSIHIDLLLFLNIKLIILSFHSY